MQSFLNLNNVSVEYVTQKGRVKAVSDVSLTLERGSTLALVGESGCGKSTLGFAILRMIPQPGRITNGEIEYDGLKLLGQSDESMRQIRGAQISMIFQDPMTSLNPLLTVEDHFLELFRTHTPQISREDAISQTAQLLDSLGIGRERMNDYPHQFSGGMRQRVMIGLSLALKPRLIIADEPTTALDVIVEAQILNLLKELKEKFGLTLILITHNIGIVAEMADVVGVMYAGNLVELSPVTDIFENPLHPYTKGLLESVANITHPEKSMKPIPGSPPDLITLPPGCKFHPRCPKAFPPCSTREPQLLNRSGRLVSCHLYD